MVGFVNFEFNAIDLIRLRKLYKKAPKEFTEASARVLNEFAFQAKDIAPGVISSKMVVRSKGFVKRSFAVEKESLRTPVHRQAAFMGSVKRPRFSGWAEQQRGIKSKKTRTVSSHARAGGNLNKMVMAKARLRKGKKFRTPNKFWGKNKHQKAVSMLQYIFEKKEFNSPFVLYGHRTFQSGLYIASGSGIKILQNFDRNIKPVKNKWMNEVARKTARSVNRRKIWADAVKRTLKLK